MADTDRRHVSAFSELFIAKCYSALEYVIATEISTSPEQKSLSQLNTISSINKTSSLRTGRKPQKKKKKIEKENLLIFGTLHQIAWKLCLFYYKLTVGGNNWHRIPQHLTVLVMLILLLLIKYKTDSYFKMIFRFSTATSM